MADNLPAMIDYAEKLAYSSLLPQQYRKQPANVLYAIEYAKALGLPPMAAITGVHVIEGKPSASAGLIGALVRKAGHKLRVRMENGAAVAEIVRSDDPDYTFRSEWTMARAKGAGLTGKKVWQQYPDAMLKARAITEVARDACEEVLFGMHYTPEELGVDDDSPTWTIEQGRLVPEPKPAKAEVVDVEARTAEAQEQMMEFTHEQWVDMAESCFTADGVLDVYQAANDNGAHPDTLAAIRSVGEVMRAGEKVEENR